MTKAPCVSIGLPVYNGQNFLAQALDSLLAQSFQDFEIIVSDNASTDCTKEICESYVSKDERIRYTRQESNLGAIGNFNFVFRLARGRYFKWASHDDVCEAEYLAKCVAYLNENPGVVWVHCDSDMIDEHGQSWLHRLPDSDEEIEVIAGVRRWKGLPRKDAMHDRPSRRFSGVLLGTRWCVDSYGLIRVEALRKTRMLVDLYGAEKVLLGELSLLGPHYHLDELLFKQRIHTEASSYQESEAAQAQFASARNSRPFTSTRFSLLMAHLGAIRHVPLSFRERWACSRVLIAYVFQVSKWNRVLRQFLKRQSVGGGGKRIIDASSETS